MSTDYSAAPEGTVSLTHALSVLARRWRVVALCAALGLALAYAAYLVVPRSYEATAQVQVNPLPVAITGTANGSQTVSVKDVSMPTEVGLVTSYQVAGAVAKGIGWTGSLDDLIAEVSVTNPTDSLLLDIAFTGSSADQAVKGANAFAAAYLDQRGQTATDTAANLQTQIAKQVKTLDDLAAAQVAIMNKNRPATPDYTTAAAKRDAYLAQSDSLSQLGRKIALLDLSPGTPVGLATPPSSPSAPKRLVFLAAGLLVGLLLGCVLAAIRERRDRTVRDFVDLEALTGEHVLGRVPAQATDGAPGRAAAEAYRQLAVRLRAAAPHDRPAVLAVVGADAGATGAVPGNVAAALTSLGSSVLLATSDRAAASQAPGSVAVSDLGPEHLLGERARAGSLTSASDRDSDVVVLDATNVENPSSSLVLAGAAAGVVIPVAEDRASRQDVVALVEDLRRLGTPILGLVVVEEGIGTTTGRSTTTSAAPAPEVSLSQVLSNDRTARPAAPAAAPPSSKNGGSAPAEVPGSVDGSGSLDAALAAERARKGGGSSTTGSGR